MITIVFTCDRKFLFPMAISAYSALDNLSDDAKAEIYVISTGISLRIQKKIEIILKRTGKLKSLNWIITSLQNKEKLYVTREINSTTYLRLLIPNLLSHKARAIYLDSDIIVRGDLLTIWDSDLDIYSTAGVQDYYFTKIKSNMAIPNYKHLSLNGEAPFCNAGVLLMNLDFWRSKRLGEKIMQYVKTYNQNDQQGINAILNGNWSLLNPSWNVTLSSINSLTNNYKQV